MLFMAEKETVFTSKIIYNGYFSFSEFYNFCYSWLTEETGLLIIEKKYSLPIKEWVKTGTKDGVIEGFYEKKVK